MNSRKLKRALEDDAICQKQYGKAMCRYIRLRMDALFAAESLFDFWPPKSKPERVHQLSGELSDVLSIDLKQPYRLLFKPLSEVAIDDADQQKRWKLITKVEILRIEDTHG